MTSPAIPHNEAERLRALHAYNILDTPSDAILDALVRMAATICEAPVSLISLVDHDRCWFKANHGLADIAEAPRHIAYAAHAINSPDQPLIIEDAFLDQRFHDCPLVLSDPPLRFYAGTSIVDDAGFALGTLCVIDHLPRRLSAAQRSDLQDLAQQAAVHIQDNYGAQCSRTLFGGADEDYIPMVSHDLNHPLRTVMNYTDLIGEEYGEGMDVTARDYMQRISLTTQRMQRMIDDLLKFARLGNDRVKSQFSLTDLATEVALDLTAHPCNTSAVRVEPGIEVTAYRPLLRQLLNHMLSNALKFAGEGIQPTVRVSAQEGPAEWKIFVSDNGIGIPANRQRAIFRMFERIHPADRYAGNGIGLAFCRRIVRLHGGQIGVVSREGSGSTFWFTLPKG